MKILTWIEALKGGATVTQITPHAFQIPKLHFHENLKFLRNY